MPSTLFSHELRILSCGNCMAPFEAAIEGGHVTCAFCGATSQLAKRDERADIAAAREAAATAVSDLERYALLRQQDAQPKPPSEHLATLLTQGQLAADHVPQAEAAWAAARKELSISASFPVQERYFELVVLLAPFVEERQRRAMLETALEDLSDDGHRQVLRCTLARESARIGDFSAAENWLAAVNPRSANLAMHTAFVFAAATLASAQKDYSGVTELLGARSEDVPLADQDEIACGLLRVDALDHLQFHREATTELTKWMETWGADRIELALAHHRPLALCQRVFPVAQAHVELAKQRPVTAGYVHQLDTLNGLKHNWPRELFLFLIGAIIASLILATVWVVGLSYFLERDPLFGAHAAYMCPDVCDGCEGPYRFASWSTRFVDSRGRNAVKPHQAVYCQDPQGVIAATSDADLLASTIADVERLKRYELEGGVWTMWISMAFFFVPFIFLYLFIGGIRGHRKRLAQKMPLQAALAQAQAREAELEARL